MDRPDVDIGRMLPRDGFASTDVRFGSVADVNGYETMSRLVPKPDMSECRHWFLLPKQQNGVAKK